MIVGTIGGAKGPAQFADPLVGQQRSGLRFSERCRTEICALHWCGSADMSAASSGAEARNAAAVEISLSGSCP